MLLQHIALVAEIEGIFYADLARVSAALQRQVLRDLAPAWGVTATVDAFPRLDDVPVGYWPILLTICEHEQQGVHVDEQGRPFGVLCLAEHWSLAASQLCVNMLINPQGSRTVSAGALRSEAGPLEFFVEPCNPCGSARYAYDINGIVVSDFCTPEFFSNFPRANRYSITGAASAPLQPLPGGHVTGFDPTSGNYWIRHHWGEAPLHLPNAGEAYGLAHGIREILNAAAPRHVGAEFGLVEVFRGREAQALLASRANAGRLRARMGNAHNLSTASLRPSVRPAQGTLQNTAGNETGLTAHVTDLAARSDRAPASRRAEEPSRVAGAVTEGMTESEAPSYQLVEPQELDEAAYTAAHVSNAVATNAHNVDSRDLHQPPPQKAVVPSSPPPSLFPVTVDASSPAQPEHRRARTWLISAGGGAAAAVALLWLGAQLPGSALPSHQAARPPVQLPTQTLDIGPPAAPVAAHNTPPVLASPNLADPQAQPSLTAASTQAPLPDDAPHVAHLSTGRAERPSDVDEESTQKHKVIATEATRSWQAPKAQESDAENAERTPEPAARGLGRLARTPTQTAPEQAVPTPTTQVETQSLPHRSAPPTTRIEDLIGSRH